MFYICSYEGQLAILSSARSPCCELAFAASASPSDASRQAAGKGRARGGGNRQLPQSRRFDLRDRRAEGLSLKRMRNVVRGGRSAACLSPSRISCPAPPADSSALQVSRLNEALLVTYSAMHTSTAGTNFEAVDRVVRIVRELDRYHGFAAAPRPREELEARRLPPPVERPLALEGPGQSDSQITTASR